MDGLNEMIAGLHELNAMVHDVTLVASERNLASQFQARVLMKTPSITPESSSTIGRIMAGPGLSFTPALRVSFPSCVSLEVMDDILGSDLYAKTMQHAHSVVEGSHRDIWTSAAFLRDCESPLEAAWRVWWSVATNARYVDMPLVQYQHKLRLDGKSYRLDVAMFTWRGHSPVLAVELDGHTYHERTPEQVAERNARDRALQSAGWVVLHFSYTEIVTRGLECAIEALERFDAALAARPRRTA